MAYLVDKKSDTGIFSSAQSAFHGLKVERRTFANDGQIDEGILTYTKAFMSDPNVAINLADYGTPYNGVDDANTGDANQYNRTLISNQGTELADGRTPGSRAYDGVRFDNSKLTYYMNADGFLVARYFADFTYNTGSAGNTRNYTT